jgi:putative oxidoreductase
VLLGIRARIGALALALWLVPTTLLYHAFWTFEEATAYKEQLNAFLRNLVFIAALLLIVRNGSGGLSLVKDPVAKAP